MTNSMRFNFLFRFGLSVLVGVFVLTSNSYAVIHQIGEHRYYFSTDEPDIQNMSHLLGLGEPNEDAQRELLSGSQKILLLSDGNRECDYPLAESIQKIVPADITIFKTGIDLPCLSRPRRQEPRGVEIEENLVRVQMNNQEPIPDHWQSGEVSFKTDNAFDTILMRRGLCHCLRGKNFKMTCGGMRMHEKADIVTLLGSVAQALNKENPHSVAILHGEHPMIDFSCKAQLEQETQTKFEEAISEIKGIFPMIDVKMIYTQSPNSLYTKEIPVASDSTKKEVIPMAFMGIQMKIGSSPSEVSAPLPVTSEAR